jgi:hypothetical protein
VGVGNDAEHASSPLELIASWRSRGTAKE